MGIQVELPDGFIFDTGTDDREQAERIAGIVYRQRTALPGFGRALVQGLRDAAGGVVEGAGIVAGSLLGGPAGGSAVERMARSAGEAIRGQPPEGTRPPQLEDLVERPLQALPAIIGQGIGSLGPFLAGGAAGARIAGAAGRAAGGTGQTAARVGGAAGTMGTGALSSTSELEEGLLQEGVDPERARNVAAAWGPLIGAVETSNLVGLGRRFFGQELSAEEARRLAAQGLARLMARRAAREGALEGVTEAAGEAGRHAVRAVEGGELTPEERFAEILFGGIAGALTGGTVGATLAPFERGRTQRQLESAQESPAETSEIPAEPESPPRSGFFDIVEPEPFTTEEAAREYLFGNTSDQSERRDRIAVNPILQNLSGDALIDEANNVARTNYQNLLRQAAEAAVDATFGALVDTETRQPTIPDIETFIQRINEHNNTYRNAPILLTDRLTPTRVAEAILSAHNYTGNDKAVINAATQRAAAILEDAAKKGILERISKNEGEKASYQLARPNSDERPTKVDREQRTAEDQTPEASLTTFQNFAAEALEFLRAASTNPTQTPDELIAKYATRGENDANIRQIADILQNLYRLLQNPSDTTRLKNLDDILSRSRTKPYRKPPTRNLLVEETIDRLESLARSPATTFSSAETSAAEMRDQTQPDTATTDREKMLPILRSILENQPTDRPMTLEDWRAGFQQLGASIDDNTARLANNVARQYNLLDNVNRPILQNIRQEPPAPTYELDIEGRREPVEIVRDQPGVGVTVRRQDGSEMLIPQEIQYDALKRRVSFLRRGEPAPEYSPTPEEIRKAEEIFRRATGPSSKLIFAQNIRLEQMRGILRQALEVEDINIGAHSRLSEVSAYTIGDLAVLSLEGDKEFSLTEMAIHEGQHVAENLGLFSAAEIATLNAERESLLRGIRDKISPYHVRIAESNPAELRAYALNAYVRGHRFSGPADTIFEKVGRILRRFRNLLRGNGFQTADDIYSRFLRGEMAKRHVNQVVETFEAMARRPDSPEFKRWFGDSVVRNADGSPMVVYHATTVENADPENFFEVFRTVSTESLGAHFGTAAQANDIAYAKMRFGSKNVRAPVIYPVYLSIKKPLRLYDKGVWDFGTIYRQLLRRIQGDKKDGTPAERAFVEAVPLPPNAHNILRKYVQKVDNGEMTEAIAARAMIEEMGFDGVEYINTAEGNTSNSSQISPETGKPVNVAYIALRPTQIKSAYFNIGQYDPNNPSIFALRKTPAANFVENVAKPEMGWYMRLFGSPTQMSRFNPQYSAISDIQQNTLNARNEVTIEGEKLLAPLFSQNLTQEERRILHAEALKANTTGRAPNWDSLPPRVATALRSVYAATNRAFDRIADAYTRRFFDPETAPDKTSADRRRALWQKYGGKLITEIPLTELRAVNPEGAKAVEDILRYKRPYYIPMMMRGDHYMAVYRRLPNGQKKLEKIAFFNKPTLLQRIRGVNPEQYFKEQFEKRYPNRNLFEITAARPTRESTGEVKNILASRNAIDTFLSLFMDEVGSSKSLLEKAEKAKAFLNKQQLARIFRPNDNLLLAIHDKNADHYLFDALPQYLLGVASIYANNLTDPAFAREVQKLSPKDQAYFRELRAYQNTPTEVFGAARSFQFYWLLGGAVDTAIVNATQVITQTIPTMMKYGGGMRHIKSAYETVYPSVFQFTRNLWNNLTPNIMAELRRRVKDSDELRAIEAAEKLGLFTPLATNEARGQISANAMALMGAADPLKVAGWANRWLNRLASFQQAVEQSNRLVTFLAAYRAAKADPTILHNYNRMTETTKPVSSAEDFARRMIAETQYNMAKEDRSYIQRFHPVAEVATQFMSYPLKAIEQMLISANQTVREGARMFRGTGDINVVRAAAFSLAAQVGILTGMGGVFALPMMLLVGELLKAAFGWDLDRELRRLIFDTTGDPNFGTAVTRGIPHVIGLAALSRRMALTPVEFDMLAEPSLLNILGPTGTFLENLWAFDPNSPIRQLIRNEDWIGLSTLFIPRFLGNVVRGASLAMGYDQYTRQGNVIFPAEQVSLGDVASVMVGFPPPRFMDIRDFINTRNRLDEARAQTSRRDNMRAAGYLSAYFEAVRDGNMQRAAAAQRKLQELYNEIAQHNAAIFALAETNPREYSRRLAEIRLWNPTAIRNRALANFYGVSEETIAERDTNRFVRPQLEELRQLYRMR